MAAPLRQPGVPAGARGPLRVVWNGDFDRRAAHLFDAYRRDGDPEAFRRLVDELAPRLVPMVRARLRRQGRRCDARELVGDAFAQVFRRCDSFKDRGPGSFVRWFMAIAANLARQETRSERRRQRRERAVARVELDGASDPFALLLRDEERRLAGATWATLRRLALEAVATLPVAHWQALVTFARGGRTYAALAQELGLPRSALVMRIQRARERILDHIVARLEAGAARVQLPSGPGSASTSSGCVTTASPAMRRTV